jgi:hypothetical protein
MSPSVMNVFHDQRFVSLDFSLLIPHTSYKCRDMPTPNKQPTCRNPPKRRRVRSLNPNRSIVDMFE